MSGSINHGCPISSIIMLGVMDTYCNKGYSKNTLEMNPLNLIFWI